MEHFLKRRFPQSIFKGLLIDLEDRTRAEALKAHKMVRDHAGLDSKRGRALEGQARFRMMEKGFQEVCELHGGILLENGIIPFSDLKVFQPFMRFEYHSKGVIFGLAAMPERNELPTKNKSRLAGVTLNYHLSPRFDFDGSGPKIGDIFVLFLVSRDKDHAGQLEEVAIGVIDSGYEQFLFYQSLDKYLEGHADIPTPSPTISPSSSTAIKLKKNIQTFIPPEDPEKVGTKEENE